MCRYTRCNPEQMLHPIERLFEELHGLVVFKVADMLTQNGVAAFRQAEGVLPDGVQRGGDRVEC